MGTEKLFWTIGEVAAILGETVPLVRSWAKAFPGLVKPARNNKGNRLFTASDLEALKQIHYLVRVKGMTLKGAERQLALDRVPVDNRVKALERLKNIRSRLEEIKKNS